MDDLLCSLEAIDESVKDGIGAAGKFLKAFMVAGKCLEDISKDADGPEDNARAKAAIAEIKRILG